MTTNTVRNESCRTATPPTVRAAANGASHCTPHNTSHVCANDRAKTLSPHEPCKAKYVIAPACKPQEKRDARKCVAKFSARVRALWARIYFKTMF